MSSYTYLSKLQVYLDFFQAPGPPSISSTILKNRITKF